jgi:predicted transcriptional regulator
MWSSKHHRSNIEIIADILRLLRLGNASKIEITYASQISGEQASKYLEPLIEAGILENSEEKMGLPSFQITKKGLALLNQIENLREKLPQDGTVDILHKSKIIEINIGQILMTKGVTKLARENKRFAAFVRRSLDRYRKGDWGEITDEEKRLNDLSEEKGHLVFSSYESEGFPEIWIITSADRSYSTVMFPDEYTSVEPLEPDWLEKRVSST